jgi:hypothetical protein
MGDGFLSPGEDVNHIPPQYTWQDRLVHNGSAWISSAALYYVQPAEGNRTGSTPRRKLAYGLTIRTLQTLRPLNGDILTEL